MCTILCGGGEGCVVIYCTRVRGDQSPLAMHCLKVYSSYGPLNVQTVFGFVFPGCSVRIIPYGRSIVAYREQCTVGGGYRTSWQLATSSSSCSSLLLVKLSLGPSETPHEVSLRFRHCWDTYRALHIYSVLHTWYTPVHILLRVY